MSDPDRYILQTATGFVACRECGAIVQPRFTRNHDKFHDALAAALTPDPAPPPDNQEEAR